MKTLYSSLLKSAVQCLAPQPFRVEGSLIQHSVKRIGRVGSRVDEIKRSSVLTMESHHCAKRAIGHVLEPKSMKVLQNLHVSRHRTFLLPPLVGRTDDIVLPQRIRSPTGG